MTKPKKTKSRKKMPHFKNFVKRNKAGIVSPDAPSDPEPSKNHIITVGGNPQMIGLPPKASEVI